MTRRRRFCGAGLALGLLGGHGAARALMAGTAPDTPAARVDPNSADSAWSGVVAVRVGGSTYSGVALTRQHVLTAAHVAAGAAPGALQVMANTSATPQALGVTEVVVHPGFVFPYDDLALLRLAQPLPAAARLYPLVDTPLSTGTLLTLVGYGASGLGSNGTLAVNAAPTVKRSGRNVLDLLTDRLDASARRSAFFVYDFDGSAGTGPLGGPTLGNLQETAVAAGDSGSPVFVDLGGGPALYGLSTLSLALTSGVPATAFGGGGGGMVLSHAPLLDWLRGQLGSTLTLWSELPSVDVPVAPAGAIAALGAGLAWQLWRRVPASRA